MAGKLIVIEGMDGAGTTTQAAMLVEYLAHAGFSVFKSREPTDSRIGQETRRLLGMSIENHHDLLVTLALCFAADRMQHVHETIKPGLSTHDFIVLDRYVLSSMVYQGIHLPLSFVREINSYAIKPHLTVILDVDSKVALERLSARASHKEFYESPTLLSKIRSRYLQFAKESTEPTVLIDAHGDMEHVHAQIVQAVRERLL